MSYSTHTEIETFSNSFGKNITPDNEAERLECLRSFEILNSEPEKMFDLIAKMTAKVFNVPIALISFVDENQVFFKSNVGMEGTKHVDRGISLCSLAILDSEQVVFESPLKEPCLMANPLVQGKFGLRFYAGAPLTTLDGFNIGTVCILDKKARFFNKEQIELLKDFASLIMENLYLRKELLKSGS